MKKFAVVFAGQGSQSVGMLSELGENFPIIQATFTQASEVLGYDLWELTQNDPANRLNQTAVTQPALLTASYAIYQLWQSQHPNLKPAMMAGHSLGEYSALVCAGAINFAEAVKLVELRGELMQQAVPAGVGAMYAILGLDNAAIEEACAKAQQGQVVSAVNFNSVGQVVIAGHKEAVERCAELCKEAGAKRALPLPVSVPSHCELMRDASEKFAQALQKVEIRSPHIPVINNVDVESPMNPDSIRQALIRQLYSPVRWTEIVEKIAQAQVEVLLELSPGKVLTGLAPRIVKELTAVAVNDCASLEKALTLIED